MMPCQAEAPDVDSLEAAVQDEIAQVVDICEPLFRRKGKDSFDDSGAGGGWFCVPRRG
jgi:hypothetical protein